MKKEKKMFGNMLEPKKSGLGKEIRLDKGAAKRAIKSPTKAAPMASHAPKTPKIKPAKLHTKRGGVK
jgi:hypothetical protein